MKKELDEVDLERARLVAIVNQKYAPKVKEAPIAKVWTKEKLDATDIKITIEPKAKVVKNIENTLF